MNFKEIIKLTITYLIFFIVGTSVFILLFHTPLLSGVNVFFYRGIFLLGIASIFVVFISIIYRKSRFGRYFCVRDIVLTTVLVFCINLVFFTHVPVTAQRSVSIFLLGYLNDKSNLVLSDQQITEYYIDNFIYKNKAIQSRFEEQLLTGNIEKKQDGYQITNQGKLLIKMYVLIAKIFNIDKKNIVPIPN